MEFIKGKKITQEGYRKEASIMKRSLFKIVYPVIECSALMASDAMSELQKQECYKFKLKQLSIQGKDNIEKAVLRCQKECDKDFIEEFAARIEDKVYPDIINIKYSISKIMEDNGYYFSSVMCRLETVSVLLQIAITAFDKISEMNFKRTGFHYEKLFPYYRVEDVLKSWQLVGDEFCHIHPCDYFDINEYEEPNNCINKLYEDLYESDLISDILDVLLKEYKDAK